MKKFDSEKRSYVKRLIFIMCIFSLLVLISSLNSCDRELDIKTDFPFELEVMPVPKNIGTGESIEIRCTIKTEGNYQATKYFIRYFQFDGTGKLLLANGKMTILKPNNSYLLPEQIFRLHYMSESIVSQSFDVWVSDDRGHEQKVSFQFNASDK